MVSGRQQIPFGLIRSPSPPVGWTQQLSYSWTTYGYYVTIFTKTAGGSEPASYTFTATFTAGYRAMIGTYRGGSFLTIGSAIEATTATMSVPSVAGLQNQDLCVTIVLDRSQGVLSSSGGTQRYSDNSIAHWSGLIYDTLVTGPSSGVISVTRGATTLNGIGVNVILRGQ
jgi:hypothetical protein